MQNNIVQKLNGFKSIIFEHVEKTLAEERAKIDSQEVAELKTKGDVIRADAENFKKARTQQTDETVKQMLSDAKLEKNAEVLKLKKDMLDSTLAALYKKATEYMVTDAYKNKIKTGIDALSNELKMAKAITLIVNDDDKDWVVPHIKQYVSGKITIDTLKKEGIGGVIISLDDAYIRYNMTLKRMIDDSKQDIGAVLFTLLEKMEGSDGE